MQFTLTITFSSLDELEHFILRNRDKYVPSSLALAKAIADLKHPNLIVTFPDTVDLAPIVWRRGDYELSQEKEKRRKEGMATRNRQAEYIGAVKNALVARVCKEKGLKTLDPNFHALLALIAGNRKAILGMFPDFEFPPVSE